MLCHWLKTSFCWSWCSHILPSSQDSSAPTVHLTTPTCPWVYPHDRAPGVLNLTSCLCPPQSCRERLVHKGWLKPMLQVFQRQVKLLKIGSQMRRRRLVLSVVFFLVCRRLGKWNRWKQRGGQWRLQRRRKVAWPLWCRAFRICENTKI